MNDTFVASHSSAVGIKAASEKSKVEVIDLFTFHLSRLMIKKLNVQVSDTTGDAIKNKSL